MRPNSFTSSVDHRQAKWCLCRTRLQRAEDAPRPQGILSLRTVPTRVMSSRETRPTEQDGSRRVHPDADGRSQRRATERSPRPATGAGGGRPTPGAGPHRSQGTWSLRLRFWSRPVRTARRSEQKGHRCRGGQRNCPLPLTLRKKPISVTHPARRHVNRAAFQTRSRQRPQRRPRRF